ncbi:hypothetical protein P4O66_013487 [Electrophorus voltai]|uniref:Tight junction-associated protein 1 domain-containing protein n=1 Tax=Electrophorus voltai TaxID=2609070 RepID=A0AAD8Z4V1_9TELE|nr:hypothetical protein P4O66_013487 [Electrophorus voltai]
MASATQARKPYRKAPPQHRETRHSLPAFREDLSRSPPGSGNPPAPPQPDPSQVNYPQSHSPISQCNKLDVSSLSSLELMVLPPPWIFNHGAPEMGILPMPSKDIPPRSAEWPPFLSDSSQQCICAASPSHCSTSGERSLLFKERAEILVPGVTRHPPKSVFPTQTLPPKGILKQSHPLGMHSGRSLRKSLSAEMLGHSRSHVFSSNNMSLDWQNEQGQSPAGPGASRPATSASSLPPDRNIRLLEEKLRFSRFLDEITCRVLSPARLKMLGGKMPELPSGTQVRQWNACQKTDRQDHQERKLERNYLYDRCGSRHGKEAGREGEGNPKTCCYSKLKKDKPEREPKKQCMDPNREVAQPETEASVEGRVPGDSRCGSESEWNGMNRRGATRLLSHQPAQQELRLQSRETVEKLAPQKVGLSTLLVQNENNMALSQTAFSVLSQIKHLLACGVLRNLSSSSALLLGSVVMDFGTTQDTPYTLTTSRVLQQQNEDLRRCLTHTTHTMETMETEFENTRHYMQGEMSRTRDDLEKMRDKFRRLQNSYTASQRANQDLEEKLHALVTFHLFNFVDSFYSSSGLMSFITIVLVALTKWYPNDLIMETLNSTQYEPVSPVRAGSDLAGGGDGACLVPEAAELPDAAPWPRSPFARDLHLSQCSERGGGAAHAHARASCSRDDPDSTACPSAGHVAQSRVLFKLEGEMSDLDALLRIDEEMTGHSYLKRRGRGSSAGPCRSPWRAAKRTNGTVCSPCLLQLCKVEREKKTMDQEIVELTNRLVDAKNTIDKLEELNERYRQDCNLAVQLLKCNKSHFRNHKFADLPYELQEMVNKHMNRSLPDNTQSPPGAQGQDADTLSLTPADVVPTSVIARVLEKPEPLVLNSAQSSSSAGRPVAEDVFVHVDMTGPQNENGGPGHARRSGGGGASDPQHLNGACRSQASADGPSGGGRDDAAATAPSFEKLNPYPAPPPPHPLYPGRKVIEFSSDDKVKIPKNSPLPNCTYATRQAISLSLVQSEEEAGGGGGERQRTVPSSPATSDGGWCSRTSSSSGGGHAPPLRPPRQPDAPDPLSSQSSPFSSPPQPPSTFTSSGSSEEDLLTNWQRMFVEKTAPSSTGVLLNRTSFSSETAKELQRSQRGGRQVRGAYSDGEEGSSAPSWTASRESSLDTDTSSVADLRTKRGHYGTDFSQEEGEHLLMALDNEDSSSSGAVGPGGRAPAEQRESAEDAASAGSSAEERDVLPQDFPVISSRVVEDYTDKPPPHRHHPQGGSTRPQKSPKRMGVHHLHRKDSLTRAQEHGNLLD